MQSGALGKRYPVFQLPNFLFGAGYHHRRHVYGAMVLHVLGLCTSIQRLEVKLSDANFEACSVNCPCDQPNNWRSQCVSLTDLKEIEIEDFKGDGHEIDFLKAILRSETMLERMTLKLSYMVSRSGYMGICSILKGISFSEMLYSSLWIVGMNA